jgi:nucleotide-binding universal stress UspA family protein
VSGPDYTFSLRRIVVALDASPHSLVALEAAANLAARMEAELLGLFVEDVELLRLADSPCAREILFPFATGTPLDRPSMERKLRAQSEQVRRALKETAQRAHIRWSFRTVRGRVTSEVLAAAGEADLLALGKVGWSLGRRVRIGSTALGLATSTAPVLLISEQGLPPNSRLLIHYDASPAARRALLAAAQLAKVATSGITVLIATADPQETSVMQNEVDLLLKDRKVQFRYRRINSGDTINLLQALKAEKAGILVLGGRDSLKKFQPLETFLRETELSLLLLGDGAENSV